MAGSHPLPKVTENQPRREGESVEAAYYSSIRPPSNREQIEQVMDLLYRRKWTILLTFLLVAAGVAAYTFTRVPQYQAQSFVMVDLGAAPIAGEIMIDAGMARGFTALTTELFVLRTSRTLAQRVNRRLKEARDAGAPSSGSEGIPNGFVRFEPADRGVENAIKVVATSPVPEEAALLANLYMEEYVRLTQEASRTQISAQRAFLEEQEAQRHKELQAAEEAVRLYMAETGAVGLDQGSGYLVGQIAALEAARDEAGIELQMHQATLESLEKELEGINARMVRRLSAGTERKMQELETLLGELETQLGQIILQNPEMTESEIAALDVSKSMKRIQDEYTVLAEQYAREAIETGGVPADGLGYIAGLKSQALQERIQINALQSRIDGMNQRLEEHHQELETVPKRSLDLARLERARQYADQMYQYVVQQLQTARVTEESQPGYAQIIREAGVPQEPIYPDVTKNLMAGIFFGLFLGLAFAIVRDRLDNHIYKPEQLRKQKYSVIGVVPDLQPLLKEDYRGKSFIEQDGHRFATSLVSLLNPMAAATEVYRHIRTNIQFCLPDTVVRTLLVTSPSVEEGKSTTASNLAIVMAQAGRRTLLLDADLRRPQVHNLFGLKQEPGLLDLLFDEPGIDIEQFKTGVDNLYVLPAGKLIPNPSELLGSKRMRELLERLRSQFDFLVIDTPPLLAATDAVLLSTQSDATIVVTRAGKTKEGELDFGMDMLRDVGATVVGVLLNGFNISMAYGYKYRYRDYSRYGYYSKYGYYGYKKGKKATKRSRRS